MKLNKVLIALAAGALTLAGCDKIERLPLNWVTLPLL